MVFLSICTALYDYAPQGDNELALHEGELVYVLEKSADDDWWKAKKRAASEDEEEPVGLIPNNYVEEVSSRTHCCAVSVYFEPQASTGFEFNAGSSKGDTNT